MWAVGMGSNLSCTVQGYGYSDMGIGHFSKVAIGDTTSIYTCLIYLFSKYNKIANIPSSLPTPSQNNTKGETDWAHYWVPLHQLLCLSLLSVKQQDTPVPAKKKNSNLLPTGAWRRLSVWRKKAAANVEAAGGLGGGSAWHGGNPSRGNTWRGSCRQFVGLARGQLTWEMDSRLCSLIHHLGLLLVKILGWCIPNCIRRI